MRPELFTIPGTHITVPSFGAMVMLGFLGAIWWMSRRAVKVKQDPDIVLNMGFITLVGMAVGARSFYVIHYWDTQFKNNPLLALNFRSGGFEFYGGFIGALVPCLLYGMHKRISLRLWTDMVIPSLLFAMGVGRIGCFLAGCCYGTTCQTHLPWAVQFPFGSEAQFFNWEHRRMALPADLIYVGPEGGATVLAPKAVQELTAGRERLNKRIEAASAKGDNAEVARFQRLQARLDSFAEHLEAYGLDQNRLESMKDQADLRSPCLHPAQLYSAVGPLLLALITNAWFYRRKRHGTVFAVGLMLYAVERFIEEIVRADNPVDTFGLTISQFISVGIFVVMGIYLLALQWMPLRSPRAVPFVPKAAGAKA